MFFRFNLRDMNKLFIWLLLFFCGCGINTLAQGSIDTVYSKSGHVLKIVHYSDTLQTVFEYYEGPSMVIKNVYRCTIHGGTCLYTGLYEHYGLNGLLVQHGYYDSKGARTGVWILYNVNGGVTSVTRYVNGLKEGPELIYASNGQLRAHGCYLRDTLSGICYLLDSTSRIFEVGMMIKGSRIGKWHGLYEDGSIRWIGSYGGDFLESRYDRDANAIVVVNNVGDTLDVSVCPNYIRSDILSVLDTPFFLRKGVWTYFLPNGDVEYVKSYE